MIDEDANLVYQEYKRHFANIKETIRDVVERAYQQVLAGQTVTINVTGSGGLSVSKWLKIPLCRR
ncbi:MAG: hypothetical protein ACLR23_29935 [Clostridia bacterium]